MSKRKGHSSLVETDIDSVHVIVKKKKTGNDADASENHDDTTSVQGRPKTLNLRDDQLYRSLVVEKLSGIEHLLGLLINKKPPPAPTTPISVPKYNMVKPSVNCIKQIRKFGVNNMFPLNSVQELVDLEYSMRTDPNIMEDVVEYVKSRRPDEDNLTTALRFIVTDELFDQFNWVGANGKRKLSDVKIFSKIIYEEWFKDKATYAEYVAELKLAAQKVHKRMYKKRKTVAQDIKEEQALECSE